MLGIYLPVHIDWSTSMSFQITLRASNPYEYDEFCISRYCCSCAFRIALLNGVEINKATTCIPCTTRLDTVMKNFMATFSHLPIPIHEETQNVIRQFTIKNGGICEFEENRVGLFFPAPMNRQE